MSAEITSIVARRLLPCLRKKLTNEAALENFRALSLVLFNVVVNPISNTYRKLRLHNGYVRSHILGMDGSVSLLKLVGFVRRQIDREDYLVLPHTVGPDHPLSMIQLHCVALYVNDFACVASKGARSAFFSLPDSLSGIMQDFKGL